MRQVGSDVPCTENVASCFNSLVPVFVGAGGNFGALASCDSNAIAARVQPRLQCRGVKPTVGQIAGQLAAAGR